MSGETGKAEFGSKTYILLPTIVLTPLNVPQGLKFNRQFLELQTAAPGTSLYKLRKQALVRRDVLTMVDEVSEGAYAAFFGKKAFESIIHHIYGTVGVFFRG